MGWSTSLVDNFEQAALMPGLLLELSREGMLGAAHRA